MKKNVLLLAVLVLLSCQIIHSQIKYYTATGKDSVTYVATDQGLLILKRDSTQALQYYSLINDSNKVYSRALDNGNYLILGTNSSVDLYSLSNKLLPNYIGSLKITNIISIRPFGNNFAIIRGSEFNSDNYEHYIIGSENNSIRILDSINCSSATYAGKTPFYPEVVYPYLFGKVNDSSIVVYKYSENQRIFELIDTMNIATPGYAIIEMYGAKNRFFIRESKAVLYPDYSINYKKYEVVNDSLKYLSQRSFYDTHPFIDEIECTDSLIRFNGSYTYLNSFTYLTGNYSLTTIYHPLSGSKIYHISYDYSEMYYSTKILNDTIHYAQYIYNPVYVNDITEIKNFNLLQNYPNPFNPTTTIRYTIPSARSPLPGGARGGLVTLKVYDMLGREVATLVNENQKAGNYEVEFNGSNLASGIYFYRLKDGNYISTKKLVLLK